MSGTDDPLGSAAQEAGRLVEALREWLDARGVPETPIATDSAECRACPICLGLSAIRENHPEVVEQLGRAAEAMLAAVRASRHRPRTRVDRQGPARRRTY